MKSKISVKSLCGLFGKSKQAYYKQVSSTANNVLEEAMVIEMVNKLRKRAKTKRWGGRKLYDLIKEEQLGFSIEIGRDKLFDLLRENCMLVKPRKRRYFTTDSHH